MTIVRANCHDLAKS